jgi:hypothetical protein
MFSTTNWILIFGLAYHMTVGIFSSPIQVATSTFTTSEFKVRIHPDQPLMVGDVVSFEVFAAPGVDLRDQQVSVGLVSPVETDLGKAGFDFTSEKIYRAVLTWIWDTHGIAPGRYSLVFTLKPAGTTWQQSVDLQPSSLVTPYKWASVETTCCTVHYITGTRAEQDLSLLIPEVNNDVQQVEGELGHTLAKKIDINFLPRVLGQGGFATDEVYFSYPDVNYVDTHLDLVLHHELVHIVDADMGGDFRPLLLVEGLAVEMTGGHYRTEPLVQRAAVLPAIGAYIPLANLADNFYSWQHELGYLEAGSLVEFMLATWGWNAYNQFYRDIHPVAGGGDSNAIDRALQVHFGLSLRQVDDRFLRYLQAIPINPDLEQDVIETAQLFDTVRAYQQKLDPAAYFQEVWLPDVAQMRTHGIVADFLRRDETPLDQEIESFLVSAGVAWENGNFAEISRLVSSINQLLPGE